MKQVAIAAEVSSSTVSRVLSGAPSRVPITEETRQRVLAAAAELGFRPNRLARGLRGSSTGLVGLVVRDLGYPLHQSLIAAIVGAAHDRGHHVVIGSTDGLDADRHELEQILEARMVDGVVVVGGLDDLPRLVGDLVHEGIPVVGLGSGTRDLAIPIVRSDNDRGARLVAEHLLGLGHRRVGVVVAGVHPELVDRRDSFLSAMAAAGAPVDPRQVLDVPNTPEAAELATTTLLAARDRPTALFCTTDMVARGVLVAATRAGLRVPDDLSVVGFDDQEWARHWWPALSTVRQDARRLGEVAVDLVLHAIADPASASRAGSHDRVPVRLVVRDSSGPAPDP
jgi:DNA-binding LacI/PurR family transcriptional regulator